MVSDSYNRAEWSDPSKLKPVIAATKKRIAAAQREAARDVQAAAIVRAAVEKKPSPTGPWKFREDLHGHPEHIKSLPLLAGSYKRGLKGVKDKIGSVKRFLTHAVDYSHGKETLCGKSVDNVCDIGEGEVEENAKPTCMICERRDPRFNSKRDASLKPKINDAPTPAELTDAKKAAGIWAESGGLKSASAPSFAGLNANEARLLSAFQQLGSATLSQLASIYTNAGSAAQANSWVRNSLRKLVANGIVHQIGRGTYELKGR